MPKTFDYNWTEKKSAFAYFVKIFTRQIFDVIDIEYAGKKEGLFS